MANLGNTPVTWSDQSSFGGGPPGPEGPQGPQGVAGPQGDSGATGATGPKGDTGAAGSTGSQGAQGVPGGPGPTGATGATGAQGTQGIQGAQGIQGPAGDVTAAWPIGAVFVSVVSTNPGTLLGFGTWSAIAAGRVLIGLNASDPDFDTPEKTGGAKTVASAGTVSQPTFAGSALGTHLHGTGTYATSAHAGSAVADHASHTHTYTDVPNHTHPHNLQGGTTAATTGTNVMASTATGGSARAMAIATSNPTGGVASGTTAGPNATLTHSVTQPSAHTLSGSSDAISAGTPAGTVSQPTFAGSATSIVPPYFVVYLFKRTA